MMTMGRKMSSSAICVEKYFQVMMWANTWRNGTLYEHQSLVWRWWSGAGDPLHRRQEASPWSLVDPLCSIMSLHIAELLHSAIIEESALFAQYCMCCKGHSHGSLTHSIAQRPKCRSHLCSIMSLPTAEHYTSEPCNELFWSLHCGLPSLLSPLSTFTWITH